MKKHIFKKTIVTLLLTLVLFTSTSHLTQMPYGVTSNCSIDEDTSKTDTSTHH